LNIGIPKNRNEKTIDKLVPNPTETLRVNQIDGFAAHFFIQIIILICNCFRQQRYIFIEFA